MISFVRNLYKLESLRPYTVWSKSRTSVREGLATHTRAQMQQDHTHKWRRERTNENQQSLNSKRSDLSLNEPRHDQSPRVSSFVLSQCFSRVCSMAPRGSFYSPKGLGVIRSSFGKQLAFPVSLHRIVNQQSISFISRADRCAPSVAWHTGHNSPEATTRPRQQRAWGHSQPKTTICPMQSGLARGSHDLMRPRPNSVGYIVLVRTSPSSDRSQSRFARA
jgi:hypothetical protein